eukprot:CAMPEP_0197523006 /NCGR_PEP_ID=MMETSP1318-20131121/8030_1 /TAXON_ID=552666 /ORGANISM="Partenskyella glossopodia, Strain RCC365" /LENGTH=223 /DNA_ID=CAMNT_0043075557 /DNA_START=1 /DNA_END=672 /DNA_ORIENTATION=+
MKATQLVVDEFEDECDEMVETYRNKTDLHSIYDVEEWNSHALSCRIFFDMGIEDLKYERDDALEEIDEKYPEVADILRVRAQVKSRKWWKRIIKHVGQAKVTPLLQKNQALRASGPMTAEALFLPQGTFGPGRDAFGRIPSYEEITGISDKEKPTTPKLDGITMREEASKGALKLDAPPNDFNDFFSRFKINKRLENYADLNGPDEDFFIPHYPPARPEDDVF